MIVVTTFLLLTLASALVARSPVSPHHDAHQQQFIIQQDNDHIAYQSPPASDTHDLFGGKAGWQLQDWVTVDDRIRGGSSVSKLTPSPSGEGVQFTGVLDTSTLGGAGFASQRFGKAEIQWDLSAYDGVQLEVEEGDGKVYAFNVKNDFGKRMPNGRLESSIEFKYSFTASKEPRTATAAWKEFKPFYRGRPITKDPIPELDAANIKTVSIMMQSYFDRQSGGPFAVRLQRVSAVKFNK
ncbi:hypothetical protein HDV05_005106 [Chytridiales sp. JEL 0842]|nr:hypothetical protein HDV05_005106 [Chytridiales sp. JEL 0842]